MVRARNSEHRRDKSRHQRDAGNRAEILLVAQKRDDGPEHDERRERDAPSAQIGMREHQSRDDLKSTGDEPHQRSVVPLLESIAQEARAQEMDESNHPKDDRKGGGEYRKGRRHLHTLAPTISSKCASKSA